MRGELIRLLDGDAETTAYLSVAENGRGPGLVVIQEWWGLVPHIKDICDRFASEGFTALAPDLYQGESTTEPDEAASLMQALNISKTEQILRKAILTLLAHPAVSSDRVGVVGFCMGGQLAMFAAAGNPAIAACVDFYGIHPKVQPAYRDLAAPVQGHFAERDTSASPDAVKALDKELTLLGKTHEFFTYPDTDHAFFNDTGPTVYNAEASKLAWERTVTFFREHLGS